jgi:NADPH:quinone reductase-like Zn-dependent oxidoreductase
MNQESHGNLARKGGYAEYAVTTAHSISLIPDAISFEEAAALAALVVLQFSWRHSPACA